MKRISGLSLRFLLFYAVLQGAFWITPLENVASRLIGSMAAATLQSCMGRTVRWTIEADRILIQVPFLSQGKWKQTVARLGIPWYTRNLPMFVAIVLAGLASGWRRKLAWLGPGLFGIVVLDGLVLAAHAWASMQNVIAYNLVGNILSVFGVWSLGGLFVAPIFAGAALEFGSLRDTHDPRTPPPGRNEPCACGSGLKYKRCCGAGVRQTGS